MAPAGSRRNVPPGAAQAKVVATRIRNAKELRRAYVELNQSPDGADPDPLTVPKCVECGHCGWPVYPRESKVATKKTFARAGIVRGTKKEEDAKRKAQGGDGDEDESGSTDSRDTVERQADEIEDLKDANEALEKRNQELDLKVDTLEEELKQTKEALATAEDRIEFLEEAELRWREMLSQARLEIERLKQVLERASMVGNDREGGLVRTLQQLQALREKFAAFVRRRNFMLRELEGRLEKKEKEDSVAVVIRMWRASAIKERLARKLEDLECRRHREVAELNQQLSLEHDRVLDLRAHKERLQARLKQAAQRLLRRSLGCDAWPSAMDHAFRAFVAAHPVNSLENALEFCQAELERTNSELDAMTERAEKAEEEREALAKEREGLLGENARLAEELRFLKEQIGGSLEEMEAKRREQEERERQHREEVKRWEDKVRELEETFCEERETLETQIRTLETRLAVAEAAPGAKGGDGEDDDASRVVPKGQGVLCVGCLKQLVHRGVEPLPPVGALTTTSEKLEKAKRKFFEKALSGALDPNDALHAQAFQSRKDPYGLARLTLQPPGSITRPSPSSPALHSPSTGLPALRKRPGVGGSATALRASMREFQPRSFR